MPGSRAACSPGWVRPHRAFTTATGTEARTTRRDYLLARRLQSPTSTSAATGRASAASSGSATVRRRRERSGLRSDRRGVALPLSAKEAMLHRICPPRGPELPWWRLDRPRPDRYDRRPGRFAAAGAPDPSEVLRRGDRSCRDYCDCPARCGHRDSTKEERQSASP